MEETITKKNGRFQRMFLKSLDYIEIIGNKLPHPATLFALLAVLVAIMSYFADMFGFSAIHR